MRPSLVRSKRAPQASSSLTRAGASLACSSAIRQWLRYWPPRIVSAKWTFQLSRSSTLARAAAIPPPAPPAWASAGADPARGRRGVSVAEERLANEAHRDLGGGRFDRSAKAGAAGADHQHVVL